MNVLLEKNSDHLLSAVTPVPTHIWHSINTSYIS